MTSIKEKLAAQRLANSNQAAQVTYQQLETQLNTTFAQLEEIKPERSVIQVVPQVPGLSKGQAKLAALKAARAKLTNLSSPVVSLTLPNHIIESNLSPLPAAIQQVIEEKRSKSQIRREDLNTEQLEAVSLAENLQPFCLVGSAGSGKTTTTRIISTSLYESGKIDTLDEGTKFLPAGAPSIVFVSFTNQAVYNIREAVPEEFKSNCLTIHKLLEYAPVFYDIPDGLGGTKKTMRYEPQRHSGNRINGIKVCVVEESGNIPVDLFDRLTAALPFKTVYIFLGDLNQIPPVFGDAILGFKLLELPVVELKQSYRTDTDSPIRKFAYRILEGKPIPDSEVLTYHTPGKLEFIRFKDRVDPEVAVEQMGKHLQGLVRTGEYNPEEDVVLTPYKVKFGTIELNKYIAQTRTDQLKEVTYEIISGFTKLYHAIGDIIYFEKTKWEIVDIQKNHHYAGKSPQPPSRNLNRWGINTDHAEYEKLAAAQQSDDLEALFNSLAKTDQSNEAALRQASHTLTLRDCAGEKPETTVTDTGDFNSIYLAYCLTVHKALGSEWKRVFIIFHHSQGKMVNREILYTAETRARDFCRIYFYGETPDKRNGSCFQGGVINQAIPGTGLAAKLDYFRKKLKVQAIKLMAAIAKREGEKLDLAQINKKNQAELVEFVRHGKAEQLELEVSEDDDSSTE